MSHTSDRLGYDILNAIDQYNLDIIPIACHSNFRPITAIARNLPDEIALEIVRRGGVIGINFVRRFVGDSPQDFLAHIEYGLNLLGDDTLAIGADFYGGLEIPPSLMNDRTFPTFQPEFSNSSCYPAWLKLLRGHFTLEQVEKIAYKNASRIVL